MNILYINGRYLSQPTTGVQRYARDIVSAWDDDLEANRIERSRFSIQVVSPKKVLEAPNYKHIGVVRSRFSGKLWDQCELPLRTAGSLLFSPYAAAPAMKRRQVVTIHDAGVLATPQQYSRAFRTYYAVVYRSLGMSCRRILTVSDFSRSELHRHFAIPLEKMLVIPPGCDHLLNVAPVTDVLSRFDLNPGNYVLGVSSRSPIKNFQGLIQAWSLLRRSGMKLAIAGMTNKRVFKHSGPDPLNNVSWLGYVSDNELRALYENAALFVYPSFYEGFGYPPLEAMSCGCPVVVARASALPESCGDAAVYCDPSSPDDIARCIGSVLDDPQLAAELREKGRLRAAQFTIRKTASLLWAELEMWL
jgi:glycosyltransferase involved in cell wall biosynthesis